jgi:L-cystine uptake protein TcyP (sodium:dicarboxylate symporter family)
VLGTAFIDEGLIRFAAKLAPTMTQTKFTIAALAVGVTIAALIVLSAISLGAVAGT